MRNFVMIAGVAALAACTPAIPDSGQGVGFDTSAAARDRALATGSSVPPAPIVTQQTILPPAGTTQQAAAQTEEQRIASETTAALANSGVEPVNASPSNPAPVTLNNPGISDENDFDAVAERQSIESDKERIANNRANYQVIQPTALPTRAGGGQPNIVSFALQTRHPRGTKVYPRSVLNTQGKFQRNCAKFASADQAQIAFLGAGGPQRDRRGLDPDGDGFACAWDPTPFRNAVKN